MTPEIAAWLGWSFLAGALIGSIAEELDLPKFVIFVVFLLTIAWTGACIW